MFIAPKAGITGKKSSNGNFHIFKKTVTNFRFRRLYNAGKMVFYSREVKGAYHAGMQENEYSVPGRIERYGVFGGWPG